MEVFFFSRFKKKNAYHYRNAFSFSLFWLLTPHTAFLKLLFTSKSTALTRNLKKWLKSPPLWTLQLELFLQLLLEPYHKYVLEKYFAVFSINLFINGRCHAYVWPDCKIKLSWVELITSPFITCLWEFVLIRNVHVLSFRSIDCFLTFQPLNYFLKIYTDKL